MEYILSFFYEMKKSVNAFYFISAWTVILLYISYFEVFFLYRANGIKEVPFMEKKGIYFYSKMYYVLYGLNLPWHYLYLYSVALVTAMLSYALFVKFSLWLVIFSIIVIAKSMLEYYRIFIEIGERAFLTEIPFEETVKSSALILAPGVEMFHGNSFGRRDPSEFSLSDYEKYIDLVKSVSNRLVPLDRKSFREYLPLFGEHHFVAFDSERDRTVYVVNEQSEERSVIYSLIESYRQSILKFLYEPVMIYFDRKLARKYGDIGIFAERMIEVFLIVLFFVYLSSKQ